MEEEKAAGGLGKFDAIVTAKNYLRSFKRIAYCLNEQKEVRVGVTEKNMQTFDKIIDDLKTLGINIKIVSSSSYKVGKLKSSLLIIQRR